MDEKGVDCRPASSAPEPIKQKFRLKDLTINGELAL